MQNKSIKSAYKNSLIKTIQLLFFLTLILLCISLGIWQLERGTQKKESYELIQKSRLDNPITIEKIGIPIEKFTNIQLKGKFLKDQQFLLDNKVYNKKAGYEVISPYIVDNKIVLINRGWVDNNNRQSIPSIEINSLDNPVIGYTYYYEKPYELREDTYTGTWPLIIQNIDTDKIEELLQYNVAPYVVIMDRDQKNLLQLQVIFKKNMEFKHYMYAGQWFLFSLIAFIFMIILMRKVKND